MVPLTKTVCELGIVPLPPSCVKKKNELKHSLIFRCSMTSKGCDIAAKITKQTENRHSHPPLLNEMFIDQNI